MTAAPITITPLETYRNQSPYPFCPGCGHGLILDHLNRALVKLQLDPRRVVIVTDIGCVGLSDQYFTTSAFHGLHGRSTTYATGIKLARPDLKVIVLMGDGGTGIGGTHLISAARRNIGITVLVFNNFNFGMTGGQHSTTTPTGAITSTTRTGNLERPLDICATLAANGASYVYRGTNFDKDLPERLAEAIQNEGFSLLDIWELCTAYYVVNNQFSRKALMGTLEELGFPTGVIHRQEAPEYAAAYRQLHADMLGTPTLSPHPIEPRFENTLDRRFNLVVAGSAGGKVRSAVRMLGVAALLSGLRAAQRDDYPITIKSGHSVSELVLGPDEIYYTGIRRPDALLVLTQDGYQKVNHYLPLMTDDDLLFVTPPFAGVETQAQVGVIDLSRSPFRVSRTSATLAALAATLKQLDLFPPQALEEAARLGRRQFVEENLKAIASGFALADG
jgi:pyruvate/2-oxoacid:ferredoxin oxidoreductase beta subunit/Pyruvate/2-oxoacid:ferredoxin oxidoreductase gamma subunit